MKTEKEFIVIPQAELAALLQIPKTVLLDVREVSEYQDFNIGGINIPPHEIPDKLQLLDAYENIIVACSNGTRSGIIARVLLKKLPNKRIYHLEEGVY